MENTKEKLMNLFREYGFEIKPDKIEEVLEWMGQTNWNNPTQDLFVKQVMKAFTHGDGKLTVGNAEIFIEKMGCPSKWKGLPLWVLKSLDIRFVDWEMEFIFTAINVNYGIPELVNHMEQHGEFFERKIPERHKSEYLINKAFAKETAARQIKFDIIDDVNEFCGCLAKEAGMENFNQQVKSLIGVHYVEISKKRKRKR